MSTSNLRGPLGLGTTATEEPFSYVALVGRANLFRDMARLETKRGKPVVAATYDMRLMRWLGSDVYGDLDFVSRTLEAEGFSREAEATRAVFGSGDRQDEAVKALLDGQLAAQKKKELGDFAIVDDRRRQSRQQRLVRAPQRRDADRLQPRVKDRSKQRRRFCTG